MDRDQILAQIKERIFASQLLSSREKWGMWQAVSTGEYSVDQLVEMLQALEKESDFIAQAEISAQQQYAQDLAVWNEHLDELMHTEVPKKMQQIEANDHAKDEAEADALLNELG